MHIRNIILAVTLWSIIIGNLSATAFKPKPFRDRVVIFDAARDNINKIVNYTKHWLKGSDITPVLKLVKDSNKPRVSFSYSGRQGVGISRFDVERKKLRELGKNSKFTGISLVIDSPPTVNSSLEVRVYFDKKSSVIKNIRLKPGEVTYKIAASKKEQAAIDWSNIKWIWLANKNPQLKFNLKTIAMTHSFYRNNNPDGWETTKLTKSTVIGNGYAISVLPQSLQGSLLNLATTAQSGIPAHFNCTLSADTLLFAGPGQVNIPESAIPASAYIELQMKNHHQKQSPKFKIDGFYLKRGSYKLTIDNDKTAAIPPFVIMLPRRQFEMRQQRLQQALKAVAVPQAAKTITVDGKLDDRGWQNAAKIKLKLPDNGKNRVSTRLPQEKTDIYLLHQNGKLYLGVKCTKLSRQTPFISTKLKEHKLWKDECLEFYFAESKHSRNYIQLIVNSRGQWEFATNNDRIKENIIPAVRCSTQPECWILEAEIPINQLLDKKLEFMAFNVTRTTYDLQGKQQERSGWNTIKYNDIPNYGLLKFQREQNAANTAIHDRLLVIADKKSDYQQQWEAMVSASLKNHLGFAFPNVDDRLPNLLIMGDSVSMQYTPVVRKALEGKMNVFRIPANGGPVIRGLRNFDRWVEGKKWDIIIFNFGLHDSKYKNWDRATGKKFSSPEIYQRQLTEMVAKLKTTGAKLFWVTTTPVQPGIKSNDKGSSIVYNKVAAKIMRDNNIEIIDLYSQLLPHIEQYFGYKNIHLSNEGIAAAGKLIGQRLKQYVEKLQK